MPAPAPLSVYVPFRVIEIPLATLMLAKVANSVPDTETTSPFFTVFNTGVPIISAELFALYILLLILIPVIVNANGVTVLVGTETYTELAPSLDNSISPE